MGRGRSNAPPPPRLKIQRPSRARVNETNAMLSESLLYL